MRVASRPTVRASTGFYFGIAIRSGASATFRMIGRRGRQNPRKAAIEQSATHQSNLRAAAEFRAVMQRVVTNGFDAIENRQTSSAK